MQRSVAGRWGIRVKIAVGGRSGITAGDVEAGGRAGGGGGQGGG